MWLLFVSIMLIPLLLRGVSLRCVLLCCTGEYVCAGWAMVACMRVAEVRVYE